MSIQPASMDTNWLAELSAKLVELVRLPANWDADGAQAVSMGTVEAVLGEVIGLLRSVVAAERLPMPAVIPTHIGGVQLEWHVGKKDLMLVFEPDGSAEFYHDDHRTGMTETGDLRCNTDAVLAALDGLIDRVQQAVSGQ